MRRGSPSGSGGGCGIRTREGVNPTRFQVCPCPISQCSDHTARRRLRAWQPITNPAERSRMRLRLRLPVRPRWRDRCSRRPSDRAKRARSQTHVLAKWWSGLLERRLRLIRRARHAPARCLALLLLQFSAATSEWGGAGLRAIRRLRPNPGWLGQMHSTCRWQRVSEWTDVSHSPIDCQPAAVRLGPEKAPHWQMPPRRWTASSRTGRCAAGRPR